MIGDPTVEITCDVCLYESVYYDLEVEFSDMSGRDPHYAIDENAIATWLKMKGWSTKGEEHHCPSCTGRMAGFRARKSKA
jgi:hypothetical protein